MAKYREKTTAWRENQNNNFQLCKSGYTSALWTHLHNSASAGLPLTPSNKLYPITERVQGCLVGATNHRDLWTLMNWLICWYRARLFALLTDILKWTNNIDGVTIETMQA